MCEICESVITYENIRSPSHYMSCLSSIKQLVESGKFEFVAGTPIDKVKNERGCWIDDIIGTEIRCLTCGDFFVCVVNTYRGGGSFKRGKTSKMTPPNKQFQLVG